MKVLTSSSKIKGCLVILLTNGRNVINKSTFGYFHPIPNSQWWSSLTSKSPFGPACHKKKDRRLYQIQTIMIKTTLEMPLLGTHHVLTTLAWVPEKLKTNPSKTSIYKMNCTRHRPQCSLTLVMQEQSLSSKLGHEWYLPGYLQQHFPY